MKEDVLPEGWEYEQLSKKTEIILGQSPEGIYVNAIGKGVPFYQGKTEFGDLYPTVKNYCEKPKKIAEKNNVLLSVRAPVGPTNLATETTAIGRGLAAINCLDNDYKFILYQFRFIEPWLKNQGTETTFQAITGNFIKNLKFIFPPLPEQQYLSQKLTALLDEVAQTKQRLEAIPAQLKQFRQSVLADAVSGRLTEEWRENKEYELIDKLTFPKGWMKFTLGKEFNYGSCKKKSPDEILNQEWVLELEDIEKDNSNILNKITNATRQVKSTKNVFKKGDVLYGKLRPYLNKIVIADGDGVCTTEIIPISSNEHICNQYLFYWLKSPYFFNYVNEITYGVNMPRLGTQDGKKAIIVFPSKEEQTQIVQKVETYFALADEIETQVKAALENVNLLTQSILAKAFNGELSATWRTQQAVKN